MKHIHFQILLIGFLSGIFVNNILKDTFLSSIFFLMIFVLIGIVHVYIRQSRHVVLPLFIGILLGCTLSFWTLSDLEKNTDTLRKYSFMSQNIEATIVDIRKKSDFSVDYVARIESISDTSFAEKNIHTLLQIPINFSLIPGETLSYDSKIYFIEDFNGFGYRNYMLSRDIYFKSYASYFQKTSGDHSSPIVLFFHNTREYFLGIIAELYPYEERVFLGGILLGAREDIPAELKTNFNNSGLTHFIAVSGFNITILVIFFGYILQYFPIWVRAIGISVSIVSFTLLVGFSPPVIRAAIMGLVAYFILLSGRKSDSMTLVLLTAAGMVAFSPLSLNHDVSFHLSFLAVIGIIYTQDFFKKIFSFLPQTLAIREAFVLTLAALSFTLPIMMFQFGQVSLLAPLANIAVTWTIPIAMLLGFLSLIGYIIFTPLGYVLAFFDRIFLKYDILMVHFFGTIDWALIQIDFGPYGIYLQALYFIVLTFAILINRMKKTSA